MTANQQSDSGLLFPLKEEPPPDTPPITAPAIAVSSPKPISITELSREQLLDQVFQSMCRNRRWERERLFGASDNELGLSMGNCHCFGDEADLIFQTASEPALTVTYKLFNKKLTTASFADVAQYVRRIAQIPEAKSGSERAALLAQKLDEIREERRQCLMTYIRSLTKEKYQALRKRKKSKLNDAVPAPTIAEQIASLLFANDCLTEASDRRLLLTIGRLLHSKANAPILKAAEDALSLIKRAKMQWESYTSYWTEKPVAPLT